MSSKDSVVKHAWMLFFDRLGHKLQLVLASLCLRPFFEGFSLSQKKEKIAWCSRHAIGKFYALVNTRSPYRTWDSIMSCSHNHALEKDKKHC